MELFALETKRTILISWSDVEPIRCKSIVNGEREKGTGCVRAIDHFLVWLMMAESDIHFNASDSPGTILPCRDIRLTLLDAHTLMTICCSLLLSSSLVAQGLILFRRLWVALMADTRLQQGLAENFAEDYHSDVRLFVAQRHVSIFVYVSCAAAWNTTMRNVGITFLSMGCWFIEATLDFPTIVFTLWIPVKEASYTRGDQAYLLYVNILLLFVKFCHFVCMRNAERDPHLWTNGLLITIVRYLCPDEHPFSWLGISSFSNRSDCQDSINKSNKTRGGGMIFGLGGAQVTLSIFAGAQSTFSWVFAGRKRSVRRIFSKVGGAEAPQPPPPLPPPMNKTESFFWQPMECFELTSLLQRRNESETHLLHRIRLMLLAWCRWFSAFNHD